MRKAIMAALLAAPALALAQGAGQQPGSTGARQPGSTGDRPPVTGTAGPTGSGTTSMRANPTTGPATGTGVAACPPGTMLAVTAGTAPSRGTPGGTGSAETSAAALRDAVVEHQRHTLEDFHRAPVLLQPLGLQVVGVEDPARVRDRQAVGPPVTLPTVDRPLLGAHDEGEDRAERRRSRGAGETAR